MCKIEIDGSETPSVCIDRLNGSLTLRCKSTSSRFKPAQLDERIMGQVQQFANLVATDLQVHRALVSTITLYGSLAALLGGCWSLSRRGSYRMRTHVRSLEQRVLWLEAKLTRAEIDQQISKHKAAS